MRNVTGAVAEGDDFFDRAREMAQCWRDLDTDNLLLLAQCWRDLDTDNLLLLAPRRVGKTSLMKKMADGAGAQGFATAFVDVSDCADELRFVQRLYAAILNDNIGDRLWNQIENSWLGKTMHRVPKGGGGGV